jgi:hypothetical protein
MFCILATLCEVFCGEKYQSGSSYTENVCTYTYVTGIGCFYVCTFFVAVGDLHY